MTFHFLDMLYNIPELQYLSYHIYQQMPDRISQEKLLDHIWQECEALSNPDIRDLFLRLEDAIHSNCVFQERASFFTGIYLGRELSQSGL